MPFNPYAVTLYILSALVSNGLHLAEDDAAESVAALEEAPVFSDCPAIKRIFP